MSQLEETISITVRSEKLELTILESITLRNELTTKINNVQAKVAAALDNKSSNTCQTLNV